MNKKLPFEEAIEQQMSHLQLPGEEHSWQAMKQLLNKDKKRFFPFGFYGYGGLSLLALLLCAGLWFVLRKNETANGKAFTKNENELWEGNKNNTHTTPQNDKDLKEKQSASSKNSTEHKYSNDAKSIAETSSVNQVSKAADATKASVEPGSYTRSNETNTIEKRKEALGQTALIKQSKPGNQHKVLKPTPIHLNSFIAKEASSSKTTQLPKQQKTVLSKTISTQKNDRQLKSLNNKEIIRNSTTHLLPKSNQMKSVDGTSKKISPAQSIPVKQLVSTKKDASSEQILQPLPRNSSLQTTASKQIETLNKTEDTISKSIIPTKKKETKSDSLLSVKDSLITKEKTITAKPQPDKSKKSKQFYWSAGIGIQQQIPIGDQTAAAYTYNGSKGFIDDYIPGIYLRMEKPGKWFVQGDFSYGAPQSVKSLFYNRKTTLDNTFTQLTTTSLRIKKTYYHEIPLSFNYYILPKWSIGVGGIYSLLHRSVIEQQVTTKNIQTQQEISTATIIAKPFSDSFLYKSQLRWLAQTDYQLRRFSFGLRYTKDGESYIKYTLPDGTVNSRKNWSLEFIVRFRLWKSWKG